MVVEVLVAQGDGDDPPSDEGPLLVDDEPGIARVGDDRVDGAEESGSFGDLAEQEGAVSAAWWRAARMSASARPGSLRKISSRLPPPARISSRDSTAMRVPRMAGSTVRIAESTAIRSCP